MSSETLASNRAAYHNYHILETFEAGIALMGTEVKSIRAGKADIKESHIRMEGEEAFLVDCHVHPYSHGNITNHPPLRRRKLLLHKREIRRLLGKVKEKGLTIVPLRFYLKGGRIKLEIGLARGKHLYDKRESIKARDAGREIRRTIKHQG